MASITASITVSTMEIMEMNNHIRKILRLICTVVCLFCVGWLIFYLVSTKESADNNETLKEQFVMTEDEKPVSQESLAEALTEHQVADSPEEETQEKPFGEVEYSDLSSYEVPKLNVDFEGLQEVNPDIYAWIKVPDTRIDYPILQSDLDPDYYLNHDVEKKDAVAGSIFTQFYNAKGFTDHNTVIYGHNMKNGSMFANLHYFEDSVFFEEHPYVYIYIPNQTLVYEIFGAFTFSNAHLLFAFDFENEENFQLYLNGIFGLDRLHNNFNKTVEVTGKDRIITLSTCIKNKPDNRYLVQAKLVAVGERKPDGKLAETD